MCEENIRQRPAFGFEHGQNFGSAIGCIEDHCLLGIGVAHDITVRLDNTKCQHVRFYSHVAVSILLLLTINLHYSVNWPNCDASVTAAMRESTSSLLKILSEWALTVLWLIFN